MTMMIVIWVQVLEELKHNKSKKGKSTKMSNLSRLMTWMSKFLKDTLMTVLLEIKPLLTQ